MIINLPNLSSIYQPQGGWMIKNDYTGSLGTDPLKGSWNRELFCFKVYVIGEASDPSLKAECFTQLANKDGVKSFDQQEMSAETTVNGLNTINEWLDDCYLKYKEKYQ